MDIRSQPSVFGAACLGRRETRRLGRLSSELITMSQGEGCRTRLVKIGLDNAMSTLEAMRLQIEKEIPIWQQEARAAGLKQEE
jgi:hypothetical protein